LVRHRSAGHKTVFLRDDAVVLAGPQQEIVLLRLRQLKPSKAEQPEMVMAAVAAAWALGITPELIAAGLRTFESNPQKAPY
jgi:cyanophycin synthetase